MTNPSSKEGLMPSEQEQGVEPVACPFCAGVAVRKPDPGVVYELFGLVVDHKPGCFLALAGAEPDAIVDAAWNTRTPTPDAVNADKAVAREGCVGAMTPERATYFLQRFKRDEKMLGPHEQWALDYAIEALATPAPDKALMPEAAVGEVQITQNQRDPVVADYGEHFLVAHVSKDGKMVGIDHPCDAVWSEVMTAHVALRDRINERIAEQDGCPFKPAATNAGQVERTSDLEAALNLALSWLIKQEPGDSRAVSNEFVSMAAVLANLDDLVSAREIIAAALHGQAKEPGK